MELYNIDSAPIGKEIILYWKELDHFENEAVYDDGDSETGIYHVLFDGESMNYMPTHWAELPKFEFKE